MRAGGGSQPTPHWRIDILVETSRLDGHGGKTGVETTAGRCSTNEIVTLT